MMMRKVAMMMQKLLLGWALLAIGTQGVRMQSESLQSELDGKERGPKAQPYQLLMPLLLAYPQAANAFAFGPGAPRGGGSGVSTVGPGPMTARGPMPEMTGSWQPVGTDATSRTTRVIMDETIVEKALEGDGALEREGAENAWQSELGWADYLDKKAGSSYAMNERTSKAQDGYYTPDVFSNPLEVLSSWKDSVQRAASDPLEASFMTIQNDKSGLRSWPKGANEEKSRTITPTEKSKTIGSGKNFFNLFGMPVSKQKGKKVKNPVESKNKFKMPWSRTGPGPKMVARQEDADKLVEGKAPLTIEQDGIMYQPVGKDVDFNNVVDTLSAASLVSPTGEQPGTQLADGIVGTSPTLAMLDAWFQENPDGVVALPLGPDGFEGQQDVNTMFPRGRASPSDVSYTSSKVSTRSGSREQVVMSASSDGDAFVPDMQRRTIMNLVLLGGAAVPVGWLGGGFVYFFVPAGGNSGGAGLVAKDALGDDVLFDKWLSTHQEGDRNLVQGLKGDAHYLIVTADKKIEDYALNAVCTHLGCVVPWNRAAGKFICPCHGSQYDNTGKVVRGPAPLSLALAHVDNVDNKVTLTPWTETDFRTNTAPWWK